MVIGFYSILYIGVIERLEPYFIYTPLGLTSPGKALKATLKERKRMIRYIVCVSVLLTVYCKFLIVINELHWCSTPQKRR